MDAVDQPGFSPGSTMAQCLLTRSAICRSLVPTSWAIEVTDFALPSDCLDRLWRSEPLANSSTSSRTLPGSGPRQPGYPPVTQRSANSRPDRRLARLGL